MADMKEEAGHTPGPWLAEPADMFGDHNIVLANNLYDARAVAAVVSNLRAEPEVAANAHLIAAAPELLAACESAIPEGVCLTNPNIPDDTAIPIDCTMGDLRKLAAAIAKARGQV